MTSRVRRTQEGRLISTWVDGGTHAGPLWNAFETFQSMEMDDEEFQVPLTAPYEWIADHMNRYTEGSDINQEGNITAEEVKALLIWGWFEIYDGG